MSSRAILLQTAIDNVCHPITLRGVLTVKR
jgi:hypothetical protein